MIFNDEYVVFIILQGHTEYVCVCVCYGLGGSPKMMMIGNYLSVFE